MAIVPSSTINSINKNKTKMFKKYIEKEVRHCDSQKIYNPKIPTSINMQSIYFNLHQQVELNTLYSMHEPSS